MKVSLKRLATVTQLAASLLLAKAPALAGETEAAGEQVEYVVSRKVYKRLNEVQGMIDKKQYTQAIKELESLKGSRLNPYELALTWQLLGYVYAGQEKVEAAISALEKCLEQKALPPGGALDVQFNLGQLYLVGGKNQKAAAVLLDWIGKVENPKPDSKYLLSMALMQAGQPEQALGWVKAAISAVTHPPESWYQLMLSIQYKLKRYGEAADTLETLVVRFPKKSHWLQLAAVYSELKQEERALAVMELAFRQGLLNTRSELLNLVSLYDYQGLPLKAAETLTQGMQSGVIESSPKILRQLGETWLRARELKNAAETLERVAVQEKDGKLYLQVAQIHIERQAWEPAIRALRAALDKGGLDNPGEAHILIGISYYYARNLAKARPAFEKAREFARSKNSAEQWLQILEARQKTSVN